MKYNITFRDAGEANHDAIEAADIKAAVDLMEERARAYERIDGDDDARPRTEWKADISGDFAECFLRHEGDANSTAWAYVLIVEA